MANKHFSKVLLTILGLTSAFLAMSCTRSIDHTAHITLSLPSQMKSQAQLAGAQVIAAASPSPSPSVSPNTAAAAPLQHVIINISAGDMKTIFAAFDGNGTAAGLGNSFPLTVPGGNARLVQVLAVYKDPNGADIFYYGDVTQDISSDTAVPVTVTSLGTNGVGEGSVAGQYLDASGLTGPTGQVQMRYTPPGKPTMLVSTFDIIGGFFSAFALSGVAFDYILPDGTTQLFGGALDLAKHTPGLAEMTFTLPQLYKQHGGNNQSPTFQLQLPSIALVGYFGPGASANNVNGHVRTICYPSGSVNEQNLFQAASVAAPILYHPISGVSATEIRIGTIGQSGIRQLASSTTDAQGLCTDGVNGNVRYVDYLSIDPQQLGSQDGVFAFRGPFQTQMSGSNYRNAVNLNFSGRVVNGSFSYLPGAISTTNYRGVDGTDVFLRVIASTYSNPQDYEDHGSGSSCPKLSSLPVPFGVSQSLLVNSVSNVVDTSVNVTLAAALAATDTLQLVFCPYQNSTAGKTYFDPAANWSMSASVGPVMASQFKLSDTIGNFINSAASTLNIRAGVCTPLLISGLDSNGAPAMLNGSSMTSTSFATTGGTGALTYYAGDSTCTSTSGFPSNSNFGKFSPLTIYVMGNSTGPVNFAINDSVAADGMAPLIAVINVLPPPTNLGYGVFVNFPATINQFGCYPIVFTQVQYDTGVGSTTAVPAPLPSPVSITPAASGGGLSYFSDSGCTMSTTASAWYATASATSGLSSLTAWGSYYVSYSGTTSFNFTPTTPLSGASYLGTGTVTVTPALPPSMVAFMTNNYPFAGTSPSPSDCPSVTVQLLDINGNPTAPTAAPLNATISVGGSLGKVFLSSSCSGGANSQALTFAVGQTSAMVFYQSAIPGQENLSFAATGNAALSSQVTMYPSPSAYAVLVTGPGQTPVTVTTTTASPSTGLITGAMSTLAQGTNWGFKATLYGVVGTTYYPQSTFNANYPSVSVSGGTFNSPPTALTFVNGQAPFILNAAGSVTSFFMTISGGATWTGSQASPNPPPYLSTVLSNGIIF